ncbi:MAG: MFS transporter, partial [Atopobiaceae bacterium]|nr:MFS transporter [Atopobiaceae bacterium]
YRDVSLVVVSLVLMYFCHFIINTYMAKVIGMFVDTNIETIQGNALFIAAMLELPTMFAFSLILQRLGVNKILMFASVMYSIKHVVTLMAANVPMFYGAMALQVVSYALLVPATVYFANEHVAEEDRNKGQAVFAASSSIGGLLASFLGGWLFTLIPVRGVLAIGAASSVCGTLLMIFALHLIAAKGE